MNVTDIDVLNYLHDAVVLQFHHEVSSSGVRTIEIWCVCHEDSGYEAWNGKRLKVCLREIVISNHFICGYGAGSEWISGWESTLPFWLEEEISAFEKLGANCDGMRFQATFTTGSSLEGICKAIEVVVL